MPAPPVTLRTVRDFLGIPQDQLGACLRAFRSAIETHKLGAAYSQSGAPGAFEAFAWVPPESARQRLSPAPSPDVTLAELGVRPLARLRLKGIHIYTLGDCAEATPEELLRLPDVGSHTVARIQEHLASIGLTFKRAEHGLPAPAADVGERRPVHSLSDESPVGDLGIKRRTTTRLLRRNVDTVGKLRCLSMARLWSILGMESIKDVVESLERAGLELQESDGPSCLPPALVAAVAKAPPGCSVDSTTRARQTQA